MRHNRHSTIHPDDSAAKSSTVLIDSLNTVTSSKTAKTSLTFPREKLAQSESIRGSTKENNEHDGAVGKRNEFDKDHSFSKNSKDKTVYVRVHKEYICSNQTRKPSLKFADAIDFSIRKLKFEFHL